MLIGFLYLTTALLLVASCTGLKFWKTPSRKIYAVEKEKLRGKLSRSPTLGTRAQESSEGTNRSADCPESQQALEVIKSLKDLKADVEAVQMAIWVKNGIPSGLRIALLHAFKCKICQATPFTPPIILAKCCTSIIGCQTCVDTWYSGTNALNKNCPLCQQDRGYAQTAILHGLDEITAEVRKLFENLDRADGQEFPIVNITPRSGGLPE